MPPFSAVTSPALSSWFLLFASPSSYRFLWNGRKLPDLFGDETGADQIGDEASSTSKAPSCSVRLRMS